MPPRTRTSRQTTIQSFFKPKQEPIVVSESDTSDTPKHLPTQSPHTPSQRPSHSNPTGSDGRPTGRPRSVSVESEGSEGLGNILFSPARPINVRVTGRRIVSSEDDEDTHSAGSQHPRPSRKRTRNSHDGSSSSPPPATRTRRSTRPHGGRSNVNDSSESDFTPHHPKRTTHAKPLSSNSESLGLRGSLIVADTDSGGEGRRHRKPHSRRRKRVDPDEDNGAESDELELSEPERFQTSSRLRVRGDTRQQVLLRKLQQRRQKVTSVSEESDGEHSDDGAIDVDADSDFIVSDGSLDPDLMPAEFSVGGAQTTEYKFKVVFQYIVLIVIHGADVLPLRGEQKSYMQPVAELRQRMRGIRDLRVRGQIWKAEFVRAMERYPEFVVTDLPEMESYCDACNRRNQHCWLHVTLRGAAYDRESHALLPPSAGSHDDDDATEPGVDVDGLPVELNMGPHCCSSSRLFHELTHWEHTLFLRVRQHYHDLLRAKNVEFSDDSDASPSEVDSNEEGHDKLEERRRWTQTRVAKVRRSALPDEGDVNDVTEWMDSQGYQVKAFKEFSKLEDRARGLGGDGQESE